MNMICIINFFADLVFLVETVKPIVEEEQLSHI